ncbi:MAG: DedA family protein [Pseudomonadota bacterium]
MTDAFLNLIPIYGPFLIALVVLISCSGIPLPSSMLVMAGGGFAATGDLVLWQVALAGAVGFVLGDQMTFQIGRCAGGRVLGYLGRSPARASAVTKAQDLLERRGPVAVFLSRTVLSPIGPYVTYAAAALDLGWSRFSVASALGALIWTSAYCGLGYIFANQLTQVAAAISSGLGFIAAAVILLGALWWLRSALRRARAAGALD